MPADQHRDVGVMSDGGRDASHRQISDGAASVRAHHNDLGASLVGDLDDPPPDRRALDRRRLGLEPSLLCPLNSLLRPELEYFYFRSAETFSASSAPPRPSVPAPSSRAHPRTGPIRAVARPRGQSPFGPSSAGVRPARSPPAPDLSRHRRTERVHRFPHPAAMEAPFGRDVPCRLRTSLTRGRH
jgi:hypothetical protein